MKVKKILLKGVTYYSVLTLGPMNVLATENTAANPDETNTPLQGILNLSENGGYNPNPPSNLNQKTEIGDSYFGIAYVPSTISFRNTPLEDTTGTQSISAITSDKTYNIAVKDKYRKNNHDWSLKGKLTENISNENSGIRLNISSNRDVKRNVNNGIVNFSSEDLTEQIKKTGIDEVNEVLNIDLNTEYQTIMYNDGYFTNGVYDYEISDAQLIIPNVDKVKPQEINTAIRWNLESVPNKVDLLIEELKALFVDANYTQLREYIPLKEIKELENTINSISDPITKKINLEHYNKYVKGYFVQWDLKGSNNSDYNNTVKFIGSDTKKKAILRVYRRNNEIVNDSSLGSGTYVSVKVKRGDIELHTYSETGDNDGRTEVLHVWEDLQPGDIIEYDTYNKASKLDVFPADYKKSESPMKYIVSSQYKILPYTD